MNEYPALPSDAVKFSSVSLT